MVSSATGMEQILADIQRIQDAVSAAGAAAIMSTASQAGIEEARSRVRVRTGPLRSSISWQGSGTSGSLGSDLNYAAVNEFGSGRMSAQPYINPGAVVMVQAIMEELNKTISSGSKGAV